ncbi:MAG: serine/threonine-protein kinase [Pseudomonadota bacterium]
MISDRAAELFDAASSLEGEAREAFLATHCADEPALRAELRKLLTAHDQSEQYFSGLADEISLRVLADADKIMPAGKVIGQWRLGKRIGQGGMGAVYHATRVDGQFDQKVALKILPTGMDSDHARARFVVERQILAGLTHDNIARLLDGGVTADGVPYFVMDFVDGQPIDSYCEQHQLDVKARLRLLLNVAKAVQYAHRNLIVHRDLKPSNVLVTNAGAVRLLDFGIAKILDVEHGEELTQQAQRPATPAYSSPEMLRGDRVDVTSDVYSIGVLMYKLLTGSLPLHYERMSIADMCQHAATVQPPPMRSIASAIPDELDAIVAKALRKLPAERYPSVESLANDIGNYLDGLPVTATPPSRWYRFKKFVARHQLEAASATFAAAALIAIAVVSVRSSITAERQAERIALERDRAEQTLSFLVSIFDRADPSIAPGEQTAIQILQAGRERLEAELADQPAVQAELLKAMSLVYQSIREPDEVRQVLERELELRQSLDDRSSAGYGDLMVRLALADDLAGNYDQSLSHAREALSIGERTGSLSLRATAHRRIGRVHHLQGNYALADTHYRQSLGLFLETTGSQSLEVAQTRLHLGNLLNHQGDAAAAIAEFEHALSIRKTHYDRDHADIVEVLLGLAPTMLASGKLDEAQTTFEAALLMNDRLYGPDNSYNMYVHSGLGKLAEQRGNFALAATHFDQTVRLVKQHTPQSPNLGFALSYVGRANAALGNTDVAIEAFRDALAVLEQKLSEHWLVGDVRWRLGVQLAAREQFAEADTLIQSGVARVTSQWGPDDDRTLAARAAAATLYEAMGDSSKAAAYR